MGWFSSSSPFDSDVEKATDEKNTAEDWGLIMDICDKVGSSSAHAKDCLRSIVKRLNHQDPHIVMQAITRSQGRLSERLRQLLKKWAEGEFRSDPQLNLIPSLYNKLRQEGMDFSSLSEMPKQPPPLSKDPNVVSSQQEEDDIAKAIELSLKDSQQSPKTQSSLYPSANLSVGASSVSVSEPRKVRALYDFEAAEDNELTFSAGEILHVTDDSDANWWKGFNQRGEGLFPSNFVTSDLSVEPEQFKVDHPKKSVQFRETVEVKTLEEPHEVEIDEQKIDRLLHLLHEADPTGTQPDSEEMLSLEEQVNGMGPLIDQELERVDRKHAQLTQLSADLVEAVNLYHTLMREPPYHAAPKPPYGYPPAAQMYNGVPGGGPFSAGPFPLAVDQYGMTLPAHFQPVPRQDEQRLAQPGPSFPPPSGMAGYSVPGAYQQPSAQSLSQSSSSSELSFAQSGHQLL
ncbi:signal transducing adapter molecule 1 isoform X2 [Bacillus rossius redtenbacheri]|uniref:signal transducing adapter molecule 1 isoform X2 n=1 Tax=Bacillus rossius redtenbacheri TaxID=93214 RepID=UPI002FDCA08A